MTFFDALETLRRALRASPDHLIAQAEALIAARDAEGLVRFVREAIMIYPGSDNGIGDVLSVLDGARSMATVSGSFC